MRIRVKLTLLLLLFSLVPMISVEIIDTIGFARTTERVESQLSENITHRIEQELLVHVGRTADKMSGLRSRVMSITQTQATVFADALRETQPSPTARVFTGDEFDDLAEGEIPPGFQEQPGWAVGEHPPVVVSYEAGVIRRGPDASDAAFSRVRAQLAASTPILEALSEDLRTSIRAQFIGTLDGTHFSYPGKGGFADYDPRTRDWFAAALTENAAEPGGVDWTGPYIDAITGEPRLTAAAAVIGPDGELAGVTGVDFALSRAVDLLTLPPDLALGSAAWVVVTEDDTPPERNSGSTTGDEGASPRRILVSTREGNLQTVPTEPDDPRFDAIVAALRQGKSGAADLTVDGQPGRAAFGPIGDTTGLVMFVPSHRVESLIGTVRQELRLIAHESFRILIAFSVLVVLLCLLGAYLTGRTVSRPIRRLADAAQLVSEGDLQARAAVRPRGDEIGKLARAFNEMVPALADRMRLRESVELANELQQGLLPAAAPEIPGFDVFGIAEYCDETGGDYFDYLTPIELGEGRFGLALGDVTGHGIPAALIMTSARALLQSHARHTSVPHEVLNRMNETIAREATHGKFMTFLLIVLDTRRDTIEVANAGHDPALILRTACGTFDELPKGGLPLGVQISETYETQPADPLNSSDILILGTDGIWETRNRLGEFYGKQRLRELIRDHAGDTAEAIGRAILADLSKFRGATPVLDDITFIIAKAVGTAD